MSEQKQAVEARGSNVEAAISAGLARLGLARDDVIIEVIDEGSRGLLGLGARDAVVRLKPIVLGATFRPAVPPATPPAADPAPRPKPAPAPAAPAQTAVSSPPKPAVKPAEAPRPVTPAKAETPPRTAAPAATGDDMPDADEGAVASDMLQEMLDKLSVKASVRVSVSEPDDLTGRRVNVLNIEGEDLTVLIGPRGETLNALQYILRLMVGHRMQQRSNFVIDVQGYRERRAQALSRLAERMAQKAMRQKRPISLEPMPPYERRIIHMALRDHKSVYTQSVGEGNRRKVRILPK